MPNGQPSGFNISFFDMKKAKRNFNAGCNHVVGYARLSFDEDGDNFVSIENQMSILSDFYHRQYENATSDYLFIADDNVSGYKFERDGLYRLMSLIEEGKCNVILAKDLSRIGRHGALTQLFIEQCERVGIRIHAMNDYDSTKESDDLILGIRAWSNERVVKDTSAKIRKIVQHKQANGTWLCAVPFGYRVVDYQKGKIEVVEKAAEIVRRIFDLYLEGMGVTGIARILTREHVPTSNMILREMALANGDDFKKRVTANWHPAFVSETLANEFYIGTLITGRYQRDGINGKDVRTGKETWNKFENHHEAIVDAETFKAVQEIKASRAKNNFRTKNCREHMFHGVVFCGDCGSVEYAYAAKKLATQYVCSTYFKYGKEKCTRHRIKESLLTSIAISFLKLARESCREAIDALDSELFPKRVARSNEEAISRMERELTDLDAQLRVIEEQRIKQIIAHPEREESINSIYDDMARTTQRNRAELSEKIEQLRIHLASKVDSVKKAQRTIDVIDQVIESGTLTRRAILAIFDKITVYADGNINIELKPYLRMLDPQSYSISVKPYKHPEESYTITSSRGDVSEGNSGGAGINNDSEGDPLEIYTDHDGEVVLKKYSPIGEIATIAKDYTDSLYRTLGHVTLISDRDAVVAVSGAGKRDQFEKALSAETENIMQGRTAVMKNLSDGERMLPLVQGDQTEQYTGQIIAPILADGEIVGCLMLAERESGVRMTAVDMKVAETTAVIIGRQMEQ